MSVVGFLTILYACVGVIGLMGFIPVIKDVYFHRKKKASAATFMIWSFTSFTSFNYGVFVVQDKMFMTIAAVNFAFCFTILMMLLFMELEGTREINNLRMKLFAPKKFLGKMLRIYR